MSWVPLDLASLCTPLADITACQPSTFMFLQLVVRVFGGPKPLPNGGGFQQPQLINFFDHQQADYDFIIVGAGTAGCVVANRLSGVNNWRVLLLEAGDDEPQAADVPSFATMMQHSNIDWDFRTQPTPRACRARMQQQCSWARGRVMGGSSTINFLIYFRGGPRDYDEWEAMGNPGWSYRDLLPTFIAMERNGNIESVDPRYHGTDGDMSVQYFPYQDQNVFHFLNAYQELGLELFDQNTERQVGTSLIQTFSSNGLRFTSNDAYIRPIRNQRPNLVVQRNAYVTRVLIDQNNRAYGVEYVQNGQILQATASKEVILSAGSLMNPKILMLSGVGPSNILQQFNIQVLKDLPVGQNLHDHTTTDGVVIALTNLTATTATDQQRVRDVFQFRQNQRGPLAGTATLQVNAFVQTRYENEEDRPDIQFSLDPTNVRNFFTDPVLTAAATVDPRAYYDGVMVRPILLNPASRGYVTLNATDPLFGLPLVFPNTFQEDIDLRRMVEGMKQGVSITSTPAMRRIGARVVTIPLPACRHLPFGTDDYWACVAMSYTTTIYHPVGTCKMGPANDPSAVVDSRLRVYGISNLRVIDASIMPKIMRANPEAGILAIGQKGAEFIISDWAQSERTRTEAGGDRANYGGWFDRIFSRFW